MGLPDRDSADCRCCGWRICWRHCWKEKKVSKHSQDNEQTKFDAHFTRHTLQPSDTSKPEDESSSPPPSSVPNQLSATVLANTSIATTICPGGDRLLFFQDVCGKLRVAQRSVDSDWAIRPNDTIPSNARLGTALSASCVNIPVGLPSNVYLNPGRFVSSLFYHWSVHWGSKKLK